MPPSQRESRGRFPRPAARSVHAWGTVQSSGAPILSSLSGQLEPKRDRQPHVRRRRLRDRGPVDELHHGVHNRLRVHHHVDAVHGNVEQQMRLDHLKRLVHEARRVHRHHRPHVPCWVLEGVGVGRVPQLGGRASAKGAARRRHHQAAHLTVRARSQGLRERGVLGIHGDKLIRTYERTLHERATGNERLLVGQRQGAARGERGERRPEAD